VSIKPCPLCGGSGRACGRCEGAKVVPHYLHRYAVHFEIRERGAIGVFEWRSFETLAATPTAAVDIVRADIANTFETRFGGTATLLDDKILHPVDC